MALRVVKKVDGSVPLEEILCTTYQMRNFYRQLADGFFQAIDVMNYVQHHAAALMARPGDHVLDVCCGRGLILPLLRYHRKDIASYTGVDIAETNMAWTKRRVTSTDRIEPGDYYPFETTPVVCDVAEMTPHLREALGPRRFDLIVYTSSIEHMHKEHGAASLRACRENARPGGTLFLSCPNTPEDRSGYDTQYAAHVYEWHLSELRQELQAAGWWVEKEIGLVGNVSALKGWMKKQATMVRATYQAMIDYLPREWAGSLLFIDKPELAKEVALVCKPV